MYLQQLLVAWALALGLSNAGNVEVDVTPVQKVIQLIQDLKAEIEAESSSEDKSYGEFKKFCEDTSAEKTTLITEKAAAEEADTATLNDKTAAYEKKNTDIQDLKAQGEKLKSEKETNLKECKADKTAWEANDNELTTAITALKEAITKLKDSGGASLLEVDSAARNGLKLAEALGMVSEKQKDVVAFLQGGDKPWLVDPDQEYNKKEYSYQSMAIIQTLQELQTGFEAEHKTASDEWAARKKACEDYDKAKDGEISTNSDGLETAEQAAADLKAAMAELKTTLATTKKTLKEAREYFAELTENCAARAADFKQRTTHRAQELEAIDAALKILMDEVKGLDKNLHPEEFAKGEGLISVQQWIDEVDASLAAEAAKKSAPSFLQEGNLLRRGRFQQENRQAAAAGQLHEAAGRLESSRLEGLAKDIEDPPASTAGDTLGVVKKMVEDMITSLLKEADEEASNKGFCDTELAKAKHERNRRFSKSYKLGLEIASTDKKRATLVDEMDKLDISIKEDVAELANATTLRENEKRVNKKTIADSILAAKGVGKALVVLEDFYKKAAHNHKGVQYKSGHRPEGAPDSGVEGTYGGKQSQASGITAMLEVCRDDFIHTQMDTEEDEAKAAKDFAKFKSASMSEISGNKVSLKMSKEEFVAALQNIASFKIELKEQTKLLNTVLETLEGLKPRCVDNVEPYEVRVAKRQQEIDALKDAMCILDPDKVEEACKE
mmetsp:Transcript_84377/g.149199  ORF Transcript_84377/g.149199 Transcript_84377/m.149199 type:complete len:725 (+) Transcript_84377:68-2242(+)|eukprot:CAMPEP_0197655956 /NCGR_PEP_ID=MMETSP1338-20131121/39772_1 /TAXON_ID=43686 ORGANISM="Pelagodinium beii, Strain RCC1491" /NCGR_SAMPLE_ID=MMETSP1338 /ASSEMBLY_ACC=CAM_ASM_000754 /LENGTH=724 /DNA_ID=CAMNT_0043231717 /DNA_START=68 /DNA_END=2242 /DNA_ORIENTATION=+